MRWFRLALRRDGTNAGYKLARSLGASAGYECWVRVLGASAGCQCAVPVRGASACCQCLVPVPGASASCQCLVPVPVASATGNWHWQLALATDTGTRRWQLALAPGTGTRHWQLPKGCTRLHQFLPKWQEGSLVVQNRWRIALNGSKWSQNHPEHLFTICLRCFFPQPIVEGLLNSRRRVSDRPSWILTSKTPARKWKNEGCYCCFFLYNKELRAVKRKSLRKRLILRCSAT